MASNKPAIQRTAYNKDDHLESNPNTKNILCKYLGTYGARAYSPLCSTRPPSARGVVAQRPPWQMCVPPCSYCTMERNFTQAHLLDMKKLYERMGALVSRDFAWYLATQAQALAKGQTATTTPGRDIIHPLSTVKRHKTAASFIRYAKWTCTVLYPGFLLPCGNTLAKAKAKARKIKANII